MLIIQLLPVTNGEYVSSPKLSKNMHCLDLRDVLSWIDGISEWMLDIQPLSASWSGFEISETFKSDAHLEDL